MIAYRAQFRGFAADIDMSAVTALPAILSDTYPNFTGLNILKKFEVTLLVMFLDFSDTLKLKGNILKAFGTCLLGKLTVHLSPLLVLAGCGSSEIGHRISDTSEMLKPKLGMLLFVIGGFLKNSRYLFISVLLGL